MKTLISCILLLSSFLTTAMAQTNFYDLLVDYTRMVELLDEDSLKSVYTEKTEMIVREKMRGQNLNDSIISNITSDILARKYQTLLEFKQRVRILKPYIDLYMTEEDVVSLVRDLSYAKDRNIGVSFYNHISDEEREQMLYDIKDLAIKYISGDSLKKIKNVKCPNEFRNMFMQRYDNVLKAYIETVIRAFRTAMGKEGYRDAVGKMQEYIFANYREILLKDYIGKYQLNDIRTMNNIAFGDAAKKAQRVIDAVLADKKKFADKCVESHVAVVKNMDVCYNPDSTIEITDIIKDVQESYSEVKPNFSGPIFDLVEEMPSFPGGQAALMQFLSSHVKYPAVAEENGIQGRVIVNFIIEEDGSISGIKIDKSAATSLDMEAVRLVRSMPKWIPGRQNGKPVRVHSFVPVVFRLQ